MLIILPFAICISDIDPMTIILKDLERLLTNAVTGGHHVKGIWDLPKPTWWPDDVKFCSPNFRKHWGMPYIFLMSSYIHF